MLTTKIGKADARSFDWSNEVGICITNPIGGIVSPASVIDAVSGISGNSLLGARASRPQHAAGAQSLKSFLESLSRFALIAGGSSTPTDRKTSVGDPARPRSQ